MKKEDLEKLRTENGGYTRKALESVGVPWPPPKGWKKKLLRGEPIKPVLSKRAAKRKRQREKKDQLATFYHSAAWARLRYDAMAASDGCCQLCGRSKHDGAILHVDHVVPIRKCWERRLDPDNLQVLCANCNWGKGNRDSTDWREPRLDVLMSEAYCAMAARRLKADLAQVESDVAPAPFDEGPLFRESA